MTQEEWKQVRDAGISGLRDGTRAVGRGIWSGANGLVQLGGGLVKGIGNLGLSAAETGMKYSPYALLGKDHPVNKAIYSGLQKTRRGLNKAVDYVQNKSNEMNDLVQDTYKYENPELSSLKVSHALGAAVPALVLPGTGIGRVAGKVAAPFRTSQLAGLATRVSPKAAKFLSGAGMKAVDAIANGAIIGMPAADYAFGLSHKEPGESSSKSKLRDAIVNGVNTVAKVVSPSAFINSLYRQLPDVSDARTEGYLKAGLSFLPEVAPREGLLKYSLSKLPEMKQYAQNPANRGAIAAGMPAVFDSPDAGSAVTNLRAVLDKTQSNRYLRLSGLQPSTVTGSMSNEQIGEVIGEQLKRPRMQKAVFGASIPESLRRDKNTGEFNWNNISQDVLGAGRRMYWGNVIGNAVVNTKATPRERATAIEKLKLNNAVRKGVISRNELPVYWNARNAAWDRWEKGGKYTGPRTGTLASVYPGI